MIVGAAVPAATANVRGGADQAAIWDGAAEASADRADAETWLPLQPKSSSSAANRGKIRFI